MKFLNKLRFTSGAEQSLGMYFAKGQLPTSKAERAKYLEYLQEIERKTRESEDGKENHTFMVLFAVLGLALLLAGPRPVVLALCLIVILVGLYTLVWTKHKYNKAVLLHSKLLANTVKHSSSVWAKSANATITLPITDLYWQPDFYTEQLKVKSLGDNTYEICSIPFARTDFCLGDIVTFDAKQRIKEVKKRGGYTTFRLGSENRKQQAGIIKFLAEASIPFERFNDMLVVAAVKLSEKQNFTQKLAALEKEKIIADYESIDSLLTSKETSAVKYSLLAMASFAVYGSGIALTMHSAFRIVQFDRYFNTHILFINLHISRLFLYFAGMVISLGFIYFIFRNLSRMITSKQDGPSKDEREVRNYIVGSLTASLAMLVHMQFGLISLFFAIRAIVLNDRKRVTGSQKTFWIIALCTVLLPAIIFYAFISYIRAKALHNFHGPTG